MESPDEVELYSLATKAYAAGLAVHGELNIALDVYTSRLISIVKKYSDESAPRECLLAIFNRLHTNDLYLSVACARGSEIAWNRLWAIYRKQVLAVANSICRARGNASELADSILAHLYLPDGAGCSRIGSYRGLSSLNKWLRSIVLHQATKEQQRKCNRCERLEDLPDITDHAALNKVEDDFRAGRYERLVKESFVEASKSLGDPERLMLALRYERELRWTDIAQLVGMHPSTVRRHVQEARETIRDRIIWQLSSRHSLTSIGIEECLADILNNPVYSLLS